MATADDLTRLRNACHHHSGFVYQGARLDEAKMNLALDDVRAAEARRMVQDGYEPVLKKSRWCVLKRPENLTDKQRVKLREALQPGQCPRTC